MHEDIADDQLVEVLSAAVMHGHGAAPACCAKESRWSGCAIAINASARSAEVLSSRRATPCSVTTASTIDRGMVTVPIDLTMRDREPSGVTEGSAITRSPPAERLAASTKSRLPPTPDIWRPRITSLLTCPDRSTSIAVLTETKRAVRPKTAALWAVDDG